MRQVSYIFIPPSLPLVYHVCAPGKMPPGTGDALVGVTCFLYLHKAQ